MKSTTVLVFSLSLLVGNLAGCQSVKVSNTEALKTTIAGLNLVDPGSDAKRNAAKGDLRLVGIRDYACHPPGREGIEQAPLAELYGLRCLDGTSDVIENTEHAALGRQVRRYAIQYNKAIVELIRQREGSNNSFNPMPLRGTG